SLEPKIMDVISKESETYLEYEQFFKTENSVGVRSWLFMNIPTGIALLVMIYSVVIGFVGQQHWLLIWPAFSVLIYYALNLFSSTFGLGLENITPFRDNKRLRAAFCLGMSILAISVIWYRTERLDLKDLFSSFENICCFFFPFIFSAW